MDIDQIQKQREYWYSQTFIRLEIVKQLRFRELCFIEKLPPILTHQSSDTSSLVGVCQRKAKVIRMAQGYNLATLDSNFAAFRFLQFPFMNIYLSLATYDKIPQFSYSPVERSKQYQEWSHTGEYEKHQVGYDWGVDIDNPNLKRAYMDATKVKALLDGFRIPYHLTYSGSKGFHFVIRHKWLPQLEIKSLISLLAELTAMIKAIDNISSIDDSIIDSRRVLKLPYSYVFSNPNTGRICLPLDDEQNNNFTLQMVEPDYVLKNIKLQNRGLLTRYTDQTVELARESFWQMASNFIEVKKWKL